MMDTMQLRPATIDDLELLLHWDEQAHVIESDPRRLPWLRLDLDPNSSSRE